MMIDKLKSGVSGVVTTLDSTLKDSFSFLNDIKDAGWDKVVKLVNDILGLAPLIEATGFNMKEFTVDATLPPSIIQVFFKERDVDPETIEKIVNDNQDKQMLVLIVRALQKADELQRRMNLADYRFYALSIKIGLPPDISLKFVRTERNVEATN